MDLLEFSPNSHLNCFSNCQSPDQYLNSCPVMCDNGIESLLSNQIDNDNLHIEDKNEAIKDIPRGSPIEGEHSQICLEQHHSNQTWSNNSANAEIIKGKKRKRVRQERPVHTFITRSVAETLDDGYKWRKYGQKHVKNSSHPRSYYRCSDGSCGVTKRVQRDNNDLELVTISYEGIHNHECPIQPIISYFVKSVILQQPGYKPAVVLINKGLCSS